MNNAHYDICPGRRAWAFSLIELVIVVLLIGIIAAIAIPRLNRSARTSGAAALKQDLTTLRGAIEMYAAEHGGKYPDANIAAQLAQFSDYSGTTFSATKDPASGVVYGPYLKDIPPLPVGGRKGETDIYVTSVASDTPQQGGGGYGWWYNSATQTIRANLPNGDKDDDDVRYNTY